MSNINQISFVVVDDIPIVRYGLQYFLNRQNGMLVKAEASSEEEAIYAISTSSPDIVILEKSMFSSKSITFLAGLTREYGGKLLAYTNDSNTNSARSFLDLGGKGVVFKLDPLEELARAIQSLVSGKEYLSLTYRRPNSLRSSGISPQAGILSQREMEIAELVAEGYTSPEIANVLCISQRTVETHRYKLMKKLCISSRSELVALMKSNQSLQ